MSEEKKIGINDVTLYYDDLFQNDDDLARHVYVNCIVDSDIIDTAVYKILRYNTLDREIPVEERKPIIVYINSPGGSVVDGFALVDAIECSETPVYTVNLGACMSMGLFIYMAGHKRYAMPRSQFLLHEGFISDGDSVSKVKDYIDFKTSQFEAEVRDFVLKHSKITDKKYKANARKEWYFLPDEGKELGIVDYIIGVDVGLKEII